MSKTFVTPMGGENGVWFEKVWEGDVHLTGQTDDVTDGAVDPAGFMAIIIKVTGTVTSSIDRRYAFGYVPRSSGSDFDFFVSANTEKTIDLVAWAFANSTTFWQTHRFPSYVGYANPLSLNIDKITGTFAADLHVAVYGIKT